MESPPCEESPLVVPASPEGTTRVKQTLTPLQLVAVTFCISIGGPYGLEGCMLSAGPLITIIALCVLPWIWCLPTTLSCAELSCAIPSNGGPITWVNLTFPSWFSLMFVLWTLMQTFMDNAMFPGLASSYAANMFDVSSTGQAFLKLAVVFVCCVLNIFGVEIVGLGSIAIMVGSLAPFVWMLLAFFAGSGNGLRWDNIGYVPASVDWATFLPLVSWNMSGLDRSSNLAEEVKNPQKAFYRASIIVSFLVLGVYVPPVLVGVSATADQDWSSWQNGHWTTIATDIGANPLRWCMFVGGFSSTIGQMLSIVCTTSRALASMGQIGVFPSPAVNLWLGEYSKRFGTPVNAIILNSLIAAALCLLLQFGQLVAVDQIISSFRMISIYVTLAVLRSKHPTLERPFKVPGTPVQLGILLAVSTAYNIALMGIGVGGDWQVFGMCVGTVVGSLACSVIYACWWKPGITFPGGMHIVRNGDGIDTVELISDKPDLKTPSESSLATTN